MASSNTKNQAVLWLTVLAAPVALGFETLLRSLIFPSEFQLFREFLRPYLTPFGWALTAVIGLASVAGLSLQARFTRRSLERLPADRPDQRYGAAFAVFLLTTALPQIPTLLSTFAYMFGSELAPVLTGVGICSIGVVGQAIRVGALSNPE